MTQDRSALPFGVVEVFLSAVRLVRDNFLVLVGTAFIANLGFWALSSLLAALTGQNTIWLDLVFGPLVPAVVILMAADIRAGRRIALSAHVARVMASFGPLVVLSVASSVLIGLSILAFVIPAFYVAGVLMCVVPLILFEGVRWQAMARSFELSKDRALPLMGLVALVAGVVLVVFGPILVAVSLGTGTGTGTQEASIPILLEGGIVFVGSALGTLTAVVSLQAYLRLTGADDSIGRVFE